MTKLISRAGATTVTALSLLAYAGCGSPDASVQTRATEVGTVQQPNRTPICSQTTCVDDDGNSRPWLVSADCTCDASVLVGNAYIECQYETGLLSCLSQAGYSYSCASLPPLPEVCGLSAIGGPGPAVTYFEDFDPNIFFPGPNPANCSKQHVLKQCVANMNAFWNPFSHKRPFESYPVSASFTHHCNRALDPCVIPGTDPNLLDIFDPCSTQSCKLAQ